MKKILLQALVTILIITGCFSFSVIGSFDNETESPNLTRESTRNILYVGPGQQYTKIQHAIENATDGSIIYVEQGVYNESLVFKNNISLIGKIPNRPILDGTNITNGSTDRNIIIPADNILIEGFTIKNGDRGILNGGYKNVRISRNIFIENNYGSIHDFDGAESVITNNVFIGINYAVYSVRGVLELYPSNDTISNNVFDDCYHAIYGPTGIQRITNNIFANCHYALSNCDTEGTFISNNLFWNNTEDFDGTPEGANNITGDPEFIDEFYHISKESPAVDNGLALYAPDVDYDGEPRPEDGNNDGSEQVDIGLDEIAPYTFYVDDDAQSGGDGTRLHPFNTITEAVTNADHGFKIKVFDGQYIENIVINKTMSIIGNGSTSTIINGGGTGDVVRITADWVNFTGFTIKKSGLSFAKQNSGIKVKNADHVRIEYINCTDNEMGIALDNSNHNIIENNICISNNNLGFMAYNYSDYNVFNRNKAILNIHGFVLTDFSSNNTISNNTASMSFKYHGINLQIGCHYNVIYNNTVTDNTDEGIYLFNDCDNNIISYNNVITNQDHGIILQLGSDNNRIFYNNLIDNFIQAFDAGTNTWDNGADEGNYWSDWTSPDTDKNGIVDVPYEILGGSEAKDYYPLADEGDKNLPEITSTYPAHDSEDISIDLSEISITFSKPMNQTSVESSLSVNPEIEYDILWKNNNTDLVLAINKSLLVDTTYTIRISKSAKDHEGVALQETFRLQFKTEVGPAAPGEEERKGILDILGLTGIFIIILIVIVIVIVVIILRQEKKIQPEIDTGIKTKEIGYEVVGGELEREYPLGEPYPDLSMNLIRELKKEVLVQDKIHDYRLSKRMIESKSRNKYESGEMTPETYRTIMEIINN